MTSTDGGIGISTAAAPRIDEACLEELFRDHYPALRRLGAVLAADEDLGQELAQEAFVRFWNRFRGDEGPAESAPYLRRILVNLSRRSLRLQAREIRNRFVPDRSIDPDHASRLDVLQALARLPMGQRSCVALRYLEDLPEGETARLLGVSIGTVKSQTHKALKRLEGILEASDG